MSFTCSKLNSQAASMGTAKRRRRHAPVNFISFSKARPGEWLSLTDLIWSSDCENSRREDYSKCSFDKSQGAPSMSLLFPMSQRQLTKGNSSQLIHTLCCQLSVLRFSFNWNYVWPVLNKIIYLGRTFTSPHLWRQNRKGPFKCPSNPCGQRRENPTDWGCTVGDTQLIAGWSARDASRMFSRLDITVHCIALGRKKKVMFPTIKENQIIFGRPDIVLRSQLDLELCSVLKALINCLHMKGQQMSLKHWTCSYRSTCDTHFPKNHPSYYWCFNKQKTKERFHSQLQLLIRRQDTLGGFIFFTWPDLIDFYYL